VLIQLLSFTHTNCCSAAMLRISDRDEADRSCFAAFQSHMPVSQSHQR